MPIRVMIDLLDVTVHKENEIWRNEFLFRVQYNDLTVFQRQQNIGGFSQVGSFPATISYNLRIVDDTLESPQNRIRFRLTPIAAELDYVFHDQAHADILFTLPIQSVQQPFTMNLCKRLQHKREGIDVSFHFRIRFEPF